MSVQRGEIWLASFDPVEGHEQAGIRPALVLSVDGFNATRAGLVTVIPITSKMMAGNPFRTLVKSKEGGLSVTSYIIGEQFRTIALSRLKKRLGKVSPTTMLKVEDIARSILGL